MKITRPIYQIAADIKTEWSKVGKGVNFAAKPYLDAMLTLNKITDRYMFDSADSIVRYFLCNASSFKGPRSKELKNELRSLVGMKLVK